jgi:hypothetical protein
MTSNRSSLYQNILFFKNLFSGFQSMRMTRTFQRLWRTFEWLDLVAASTVRSQCAESRWKKVAAGDVTGQRPTGGQKKMGKLPENPGAPFN